jgi:hypothetical protein
MFNDARSKRIVVVAHCLLNQNSISNGAANLPSQIEMIIRTRPNMWSYTDDIRNGFILSPDMMV